MQERFARPPRILAAAAIIWLLVLLILYSDAGVGITGLFMALFGGLGLALAWAIRLVLFLISRRRVPTTGSRAWWLVLPACLVSAAILGGWFEAPNNALFRWRFRASEEALSRHGRAVLASPAVTAKGTRRIGLFAVSRIDAHDGQVRFITTHCGVIDSCGVVHSPAGEPKRWQEDRFSHLTGPWWHVYEGF